MDIFAAYATDETKEQEGSWVEIGDSEFLVARSGNRKYSRMLGRLVEKNQKALDMRDEAADKLSDRLMVEVLAATILLGWENVSFQGKVLEYNKANAEKLLAIKDFRREIMKRADDFDAFKVVAEAENEKN